MWVYCKCESSHCSSVTTVVQIVDGLVVHCNRIWIAVCFNSFTPNKAKSLIDKFSKKLTQ